MKKDMKTEWYAVVYNEYSIAYGAEALGNLTQKQRDECLAAVQESARIGHLYSIEGYGVSDLDDVDVLTEAEQLAAEEEALRVSKEQIKILSKKEYEKIPLGRRAIFRYERAHRENLMDSERAGIGLLQLCVYMAKELRGDEPSMSELLSQAVNQAGSVFLDATSNRRTSPSDVMSKVIEACKLATKNPALTNVELAKLVGLPKKTMENHADKINRARQGGILPKETPVENKRSNRKAKGSEINKRNPLSADYKGKR